MEGSIRGWASERLVPLQHLMIRVPLGIIFVAHGGQNLFGWWGGSGFVQSVQSFQHYLQVPEPVAALALLVEFFGGIMVLLGLLTRWSAAALAVLMAVAIVQVHLDNGFFLNWRLVPAHGHGIEFNLALLGMCLMLVLGGPGAFALDRPRR